MARPQANAKMGITPDGRKQVGEKALYSVGGLLGRAVVMRDIERWSEFVTWLKSKTHCPVVSVFTLTSFISREAPFLGVFGKIDPAAVKEVLEECGGIHHISKVHNTYTDPRQATAELRFARNHRYVRKLVRTGEINGGNETDMMRVLMREVPLTTDRQFLRKILLESAFTDRGRFDKALFEEKIAALGWKPFTREQMDFQCILTRELGEKPEDTLLQEQAGEARVSSQTVPTVAVPECVEAPVESAPAPAIEPETPKEAPVEEVPEREVVEEPESSPVQEPVAVVEAVAEETPSIPEPVAVETIEKVVAATGRRKVRTIAMRAAVYRGMLLLCRILHEVYGWPFGNILPSPMLDHVVREVYHGSTKTAVFLQVMKREGLICPAGYYKTGYLWEAQDVEIVEKPGVSVKVVTEDALRKYCATGEQSERWIRAVWLRIMKQNSRRFAKVPPPPELEEEIVEEIGWAMQILETVQSPESIVSTVEPEPLLEQETPKEAPVEVQVEVDAEPETEPVAEPERIQDPPDLKESLLALSDSERRDLLLEHCSDTLEEMVREKLRCEITKAGDRLIAQRRERLDAVAVAEAKLAENKAKLAETDVQLAGIIALIDALPLL